MLLCAAKNPMVGGLKSRISNRQDKPQEHQWPLNTIVACDTRKFPTQRGDRQAKVRCAAYRHHRIGIKWSRLPCAQLQSALERPVSCCLIRRMHGAYDMILSSIGPRRHGSATCPPGWLSPLGTRVLTGRPSQLYSASLPAWPGPRFTDHRRERCCARTNSHANETLVDHTVLVSVGETLDRSECLRCPPCGYRAVSTVEDPVLCGERWPHRCVPATLPSPIRIELWDDEVESIRTFDAVNSVQNQRLERHSSTACSRRVID